MNVSYHYDLIYSTNSRIVSDIDCGSISPIPYGVQNYTKNTTYVGSEVTFTCSHSHKLNGMPKRTCSESGVWSGSSPKCEGTLICGSCEFYL